MHVCMLSFESTIRKNGVFRGSLYWTSVSIKVTKPKIILKAIPLSSFAITYGRTGVVLQFYNVSGCYKWSGRWRMEAKTLLRPGKSLFPADYKSSASQSESFLCPEFLKVLQYTSWYNSCMQDRTLFPVKLKIYRHVRKYASSIRTVHFQFPQCTYAPSPVPIDCWKSESLTRVTGVFWVSRHILSFFYWLTKLALFVGNHSCAAYLEFCPKYYCPETKSGNQASAISAG